MQRTDKNQRAAEKQRTGENPRAVGTQRTSVNPRAEVAHSDAPISIETRKRTNVRAVNDKEWSGSGNVFRRLCRAQTCGTRLIEREIRSFTNILRLKEDSKGLVPKG